METIQFRLHYMVYLALSCRPFTTEARILSWAGPCAIFGKLALEPGFLGVLLFSHISNILTLGSEMDKLKLGQVVLCVLLLTVVIMILPMGFVLEGVALRHLYRPLSLPLYHTVALRQIFLRLLPFSLVSVCPPVLHTSIHRQLCATLTVTVLFIIH